MGGGSTRGHWPQGLSANTRACRGQSTPLRVLGSLKEETQPYLGAGRCLMREVALSGNLKGRL